MIFPQSPRVREYNPKNISSSASPNNSSNTGGYRCLIRNSTLALKTPSLPALTFGLLYRRSSVAQHFAQKPHNRRTYQVATDREAMRATFPIRALVPGCECTIAQDLISRCLSVRREHHIDLAAVDEERCLGDTLVFLDIAHLVRSR